MKKADKAPTRKTRRKPFSRIEQSEIGTLIIRDARRYPEGLDWQEVIALSRARWDSDIGKAHTRLKAILNAACVDPEIVKSEQVRTFVALMRDVFFEAEPGDTVEQFMEPVETLFAGMRSRAGGGGRPPVEQRWESWTRRNEELKKIRKTLTARERYEDIASEWESDGHAPVKWTAVRDGISDLKKAKANRV